MRLQITAMIIALIVNIGVDGYIYALLSREVKNRVIPKFHLALTLVLMAMMISIFFLPIRTGSDQLLRAVTWMLYTYISVYAAKYLFLIFDTLSRLPIFFKRKRIKAIGVIGLVLAIVTFGAMWWGALINRFNIDTVEVDVSSKDLPRAFDGLRVVQISDLHVGTYGTDTAYIAKVVDHVNALKPDLILFTGDIVNRYSEELKPFVATFSRLHAPMGVYSIMGNHDYGDYHDWASDDLKDKDVENLKAMQAGMGWKMLNNDHATLYKGNDSIQLIGVENVGDPPFHTYGDLSKAYPDLSDSNYKILMTHNPAHWVNDIKNDASAKIGLTLSGHTHAMQMRVLGFSPSAWRYETWGGMYGEPDKQLYVNIGIGTVGLPARIGATPEITLFTLHSTDK